MRDKRKRSIMHILFTTYEFVTEKKPCGGMGHYLANIATILAEHGHKVTILLLSDYNRCFEWKKNVNIVVFQYSYKYEYSWIGNLIDKKCHTNIAPYISRSKEMKKRIQEIHRKDRIDIIQNNGDHLECWYRCWNIPTVVRLSSFTPWYMHAYNPESDMDDMSWLKAWDCKIFAYPMKKADAVYGPGRCVGRYAGLCARRKVKIIESPFLMENSLKDLQLPFQLEGKKYFLFFGRMCVLKGINTIVEAIYQILKENPDCYFVFAGNAEKSGIEERLLSAAKEFSNRIMILGEIKDKVIMQSIVKQAYVCILPSRADNFPNSCIEAMGMGKVVIGTYGASFEQLINNKKSGLLIKRDSPQALVNAIRYFRSLSEEEKEQIEKNAAKRIERMQSDVIYQELIQFYEDVIDKRRRMLCAKKQK